MSDKTFKEQVEEIQRFKYCPPNCPKFKDGKRVKSCISCRTDRILAAHNAELDRIAEGMPTADNAVIPSYSDADEDGARVSGAETMRDKCQAYIKAQKGS